MEGQEKKRRKIIKKTAFYLFIFVLFNYYSFADTNETKNKIDYLNRKVNSALENQAYSEILELTDSAIALSKRIKYKNGLITALINRARFYYFDDKYEKAIINFRKALKLSKEVNNILAEADCYKGIGESSKNLSDYKSSLNAYKRALRIFNAENNIVDVAEIEYQMGTVFKELDDSEKALLLFYKSLITFEKKKKKDYSVVVLNNIGELLRVEKQYEKSEKYLKKAEKIALENNFSDLYADTLTLMGGLYEELKKYKISEEKYKKAIVILVKKKDNFRLATSYNNLGELYRKTGHFELAKNNYLKALELYRNLGFQWGESASLANLGVVLYKMGNIEEAVLNLIKAKDIAEKKKIPKLKEFIYNNISKVYERKGELLNALKYYKKYIAVNNKILNNDRIKKFAEMQTKYETERKDRELEISRLKLNRQNLISKAFIIGFVIVLFFVFLVYSRYRIKKRANTKLSKINLDLINAKKIIEEKNLHITDSIKYALRIQSAILPNDNEMIKALKDYFLIYKPKDIVSGDFYWLFENDDYIIVSVIDCTGHGVPGALMSIMGNSLLNEIVTEKKIFDPGNILNELNQGILKSLKKTNIKNRVKDGMDVVLVRVDKSSNRLYFAGARRPLFVVNSKENSLKEYKGTRQSIGELKKKNNLNFITEEIILNSRDMIYLTSDGFADQSNEEDKKYGSKQFKFLLTDIAKNPTNVQKEHILKKLIDFKGKEEQRDDITIIGFRHL